MAGHSVCIDFRIDAAKIVNPVERKTLVQDILPIVEPFTGTLTEITSCELPDGSFIFIFSSNKKMTVTIKLYLEGVVCTTVEYYAKNVDEQIIQNGDGRNLEKQLTEKFNCDNAKVLPAIKRAPVINPYFTTSDDRILEYDVDEILFDEKSDFQRVQIYHTKSYGNMLVLDDLQNLAESDLSYTQGLMNKANENFGNKEILILGGGDGALLFELLKENPQFVTMIDIDEIVMKSCRKHLRSVCGDVLDNYDGKNYKVIVGDAIAYMKQYVKEKKVFDYVFADLTDVPISQTPRGEHWDFMRTIMELGTSLLKPNTGKYMTHAIGIQSENALKMFEEQFLKLPIKVKLNRTNDHVPSFKENWCFYQATRQS